MKKNWTKTNGWKRTKRGVRLACNLTRGKVIELDSDNDDRLHDPEVYTSPKIIKLDNDTVDIEIT